MHHANAAPGGLFSHHPGASRVGGEGGVWLLLGLINGGPGCTHRDALGVMRVKKRRDGGPIRDVGIAVGDNHVVGGGSVDGQPRAEHAAATGNPESTHRFFTRAKSCTPRDERSRFK